MGIKIPKQERQILPNVGSVPSPTFPTPVRGAFGEDVIAAQGGIAEPIARLGELLQNRAVQKIEQEQEQNILSISTQFQQANQQKLFDADEETVLIGNETVTRNKGYLNRQGATAKGSLQEYDKWSKENIESALLSIPNPEYRERLARQLQNDYFSTRNSVLKHELQQEFNVKKEVYANKIQQGIETSYLSQDPGSITRSIESVGAATDSESEFLGVTDAAQKEARRNKNVSLTMQNVVAGSLADDITGIKALTLLELSKDSLSKQEYDTQKEFIKKTSNSLVSNAETANKRMVSENGIKLLFDIAKNDFQLTSDGVVDLQEIGRKVARGELDPKTADDAINSVNKSTGQIEATSDKMLANGQVFANGVSEILKATTPETLEPALRNIMTSLGDTEQDRYNRKILFSLAREYASPESREKKNVVLEFFNNAVDWGKKALIDDNVELSVTRGFITSILSNRTPDEALQETIQGEVVRQKAEGRKEKFLDDRVSAKIDDHIADSDPNYEGILDIDQDLTAYLMRSGVVYEDAARQASEITRVNGANPVENADMMLQNINNALPHLKYDMPKTIESVEKFKVFHQVLEFLNPVSDAEAAEENVPRETSEKQSVNAKEQFQKDFEESLGMKPTMAESLIARMVATQVAENGEVNPNPLINDAIDVLTAGLTEEQAYAVVNDKVNRLITFFKDAPERGASLGIVVGEQIVQNFKDAQKFIDNPLKAVSDVMKAPEKVEWSEAEKKVMELGDDLFDFAFKPFMSVLHFTTGVLQPEGQRSVKASLTQGLKDIIIPPSSGESGKRATDRRLEGKDKFTNLDVILGAGEGILTDVVGFLIASNPRGLVNKIKEFPARQQTEVTKSILKRIDKDVPGWKKLSEEAWKKSLGVETLPSYIQRKINSMTSIDVWLAKDFNPVVGNYTKGVIEEVAPLFANKGLLRNTGTLKFLNESSPLKSNIQALAHYKLPAVVYGSQALKTLSKGISSEEIEPIKKILEANPDKKYKREDIVDLIEKNKVVVEPVVRGDVLAKTFDDIKWSGNKDNLEGELDGRVFLIQKEIVGYYVAEKDGLLGRTTKNYTEAVETLNRYLKEQAPKTKYSRYTLPGGENYQETLLTLPENKDVAGIEFSRRFQELKKKYNVDEGAQFLKAISKEESEELTRLSKAADKSVKNIKQSTYKSSHWEEPNPLVHHRTNQRTDAQGNKGTFVEEIQSDWHREGRSRGYRLLDERKRSELDKRRLEIEKIGMDLGAENTPNELKEEWVGIMNELQPETHAKKVPNAPFKNTWHELALKDIIRQAVERGDKFVAFISGQQTADRYDLSKQVDKIEYQPGDKMLRVFKDGKTVLSQTMKDEKHLEEYIGKDAAKKILQQPLVESTIRPPTQSLDGQEMKVGGNWAKKFYDEILPKTAEKYIKKWGSKIQDIQINKSNIQRGDLTDAEYKEFASKEGREQLTQKGFYITPQMVKEVKEIGQPLFGNRLAGGIGKLSEQRGMAGVEGQEQLPDEMPEKPGIFDELEGGQNAQSTGGEITPTGEQAQGMEQGEEERLRLRDDEEVGMEAERGAVEPPTEPPQELPPDGWSEDPYDRVVQFDKISRKSTAGKDFAEFIDKTFVPISTRLSKMDETLKDAIRKHAFNVNIKTKKDIDSVTPFLKSMKSMERDDALKLDFALKNGDTVFVDGIVEKYGLKEQYDNVRKTLDDIYKRAEESGMDVGYIPSYFPRRIIDTEEYLKYLRGTENWGSISRAIQLEESNIGRPLLEEEKAEVINSMIRGFGKEKISLTKPSNIKERKIVQLTPEMNAFYKDSGIALSEYIRSMNDNIEARTFFGKEKNLDTSIGNYVVNLVEQNIISPEDEESVRQILKSYFDKRGTHGVVTAFKNFSYVASMGSPTSAVTQIGDLAFSLYRNGYFGTLKAGVGKKKVTKGDIGIDIIAEEFTDQSKSSKAVSAVFKAIGLDAMDAFGKETLINGSFNRLSDLASKNDAELIKTLDRVFGDGAPKVLEDLKNKVPTDDVKYMLFSELADFQPISLTEMPEYYVRGGNMRIFYMLKSYTLKQLDVYHNEVFREKDPVKKVQNLLKLTIALALTGATSDVIKDVLLGRKIKLNDIVIDNMLKLMAFSKWQIYKSRQDGLFQTMLQSILPPIPFLDDIYKDAMRYTNKYKKPKVKDWRIWQRIPLVGKFYYWWFGGGSQINSKNKNFKGIKSGL